MKKHQPSGNRTSGTGTYMPMLIWAVVVTLLTTPVPLSAAPVADPVQAWESLMKAQEAHRSLIEAVEYDYSFEWLMFDSSRPVESGDSMPLIISRDFRTAHYAHSGDSFYHLGTIWDNEKTKTEQETTYNGREYRRRKSDYPQILTVGRQRESYLPLVPIPTRMMGVYPPEKVPEMLADGRLILEAVETAQLEGRSHVRVRMTYTGGAMPHNTEVWFDPARGYYPVLTVHENPEDGLTVRIEKVQLGQYTVNGNQIHYPLYFEHNAYRGDALMHSLRYKVEPESFHINHQVDSSLFTLIPRPDEDIYDTDRHAIAVFAKERNLDLEETLAAAEIETSLAVESEQVASPEAATESLPSASSSVRKDISVDHGPGTGQPLSHLLYWVLAAVMTSGAIGTSAWIYRNGGKGVVDASGK